RLMPAQSDLIDQVGAAGERPGGAVVPGQQLECRGQRRRRFVLEITHRTATRGKVLAVGKWNASMYHKPPERKQEPVPRGRAEIRHAAMVRVPAMARV